MTSTRTFAYNHKHKVIACANASVARSYDTANGRATNNCISHQLYVSQVAVAYLTYVVAVSDIDLRQGVGG